MSTFNFTCPRLGAVEFKTFSPEWTTRGGEVAQKPVPLRTLGYVKALRDENPTNRTLVTMEKVEVAGLVSSRLSLGVEVVEERVAQVKIGLDLPLEVLRGRMNYLLNGHHRAVAVYLAKGEACSAYVINTAERTALEAERFDPLSEKVLASPSVWELSRYRYDFLEPRDERVSGFREKLGRICRNLGPKLEAVPTDPATSGLRDLVIRLLALDELDGTLQLIEKDYGLNISDIQLVCVMRDALRRKWLYDRLQRINCSDPDHDLDRKIDGLKRLGELTRQLMNVGPGPKID